jgi:tetratricopeptide (TPR) repeat protein
MAVKLAAVEQSMSTRVQPKADLPFEEALSAATAAPSDESPWERLEATVVADEDRARQLLDFYRSRLGEPLPKPVLGVLSHRAVRFAADCFGEKAPETIEVLRAVLLGAPEADWAFRPLVVALTMAERWREVLDAYDARLAVGMGVERRAELLEEAARIAKDFTGDHARAVGYLEQLHRLRPGDAEVASSLERLLERHERWAELVGVRRLRLELLSGQEARELRLRIANTLHEKLGQPDAALAEVRVLLPDLHEDAPLAGLLERLLADQRAAAETRLDALDALRLRLEAIGAAARVPELLRTAIGFAEGERLRELRRECGERLHALGDAAGALEQYAALIALAPEDHAVEDRFRQLAEAMGDPARLASGLTAAAKACAAPGRRAELLVRAARVEDRQLRRPDQASALYEAALAGEGAAPELRLESLRRLEELYDGLGDRAKRLEALERLAPLEPKAGGKRLSWALAAELAVELGDVDRALGAWQARLALDAADGEALAAARALLVGAERWAAVIDLLRRRIASAPAAHPPAAYQVRADLVEIATIARDRLGDLGRAIDAWREVVDRFGEDEESVATLADLYTASGAFAELAELLSRNASVDRGRHADRLARLADAHRLELGDAPGAVGWYGRALDVDPGHERARAGLGALLADASVASGAAAQLAAAAEKTDGWQLLLDLVPARLAGAADQAARARILEEAAARAERRAGDAPRALAWLCEALPLAGPSARLEREVLRLAEATGDFAAPARAFAACIGGGGLAPLTLAHLHELRASLLETRLGDLEGASESHAAALALTPERLEPRRGRLRTLVRLGRFAEAAALIVDPQAAVDARDTVLWPLYESLAFETGQVAAAIAALGKAVDGAAGLDLGSRRDLQGRVARLFVERAGDPAAAEQALARALAADARHVPTLLARAELQRRHPDRGLVETLTRLAAEQPDNLDFLGEAAELASAGLADEALALDLLGRLYDRAGSLLARGADATGRLAASDGAAHALEEMVRRHAASGAAERVRQAAALLLDGARLRIADERRWAWLRRAAELTTGPLADKPGAIRIWRLLLDQAPGDRPAREALAALYEAEGRFGEAVDLRVGELDGTREQERRLALRLEIVRLGGLAERRSDAPQVLRAGLAERPGHGPTLGKLTELLVAKGRQAELCDVLEHEARTLADDAEPGPSAALWADAARLAEGALTDAPRALAAWREAARLDAGAEALDALGRLTLAAGQPLAAAEWLDRRLAMTEGEARNEVAARLAAAYGAAGQRHRAIACLERALDESPATEGLRTRLADLYREAQSWESLARVLGDGCADGVEDAVTVARASEVAEIYMRLDAIERAVPVLERAVRLVPQHEGLGLALADGLRRAGRYDEAREQLTRLVELAGWRRTRKRAVLHQRLAEIARAQGDTTRALAELEQASSMDVSSPAILTELGEVAEAAGDLERAERAYRALLVQARDEGGAPADAARSPLALTEILLRLYGLARKRGNTAEADELLDSALAAAIKDPAEATRLQRGLLETGAHDELARLFEKRLAHAAGTPAEAEISAELAESLRARGDVAAAFEAQLRAVEAAPESAHMHRPLVELARATERLPELADRLLALVERRRRKADMNVASTLLLLAAEIAERDFGDRGRALELHRRAEEMQPRSLDVLSGVARLAQLAGDDAESNRVAALLKLCAAEARSPQAAGEALYRAAALELGRPETRDAGIASLSEALEKSRDVERAAALVTSAGVPEAELVKILPLYERIARQSGDGAVLLDYLERRAAMPDVELGEVREAIDLAVALHYTDRLEPLLARLATMAAARADGRGDATWALLELLRIKKAAGDLEAAADVLGRAAEVMPLEQVMPLARELAERAGQAGHRKLGAELLERLRQSAPADESVWRPLLDHYVSLRDGDGLARLVAETLPLLPEVGPRNQLRIALARLRLGEDGGDGAAAESLRDVLLEEPAQADALTLLAGYYERIGAEDDLVDLLGQSFDAAMAAGDPEAVVAMAVRLGGALEGRDAARAAGIYERALGVAPRRGELLRRLLALRPAGEATAEDAARLEALLEVETGDEAARLAHELVAAWTNLGDAEAARRVLEMGHARAPKDPSFFTELEKIYRAKQDWSALADLYAGEAERRDDAGEGAALLLEAASLRRGRLADVKGALKLLSQARGRAPWDIQIVEQLARALVAHGELGAAVEEVRAALDEPSLASEHRLPLYLLRAKLEASKGDHRAAVAVLEEAFAAAPDAASDALLAELEAWRDEAAAANASADLKDATLRLAALARAAGDTDRARELLGELVVRGAADAATIALVLELAEAAGDLDAAFTSARQLLGLAAGEEQVAAAQRLVALAAQTGSTAAAAASIEEALAAHPEQLGLLDVLAPLYEQAGELAKLAGLLLDQGNRNPDEEQRFEQLRRAGAYAVQAQDASLAIMALNEAFAIRPTDEETALLLADAYTMAGGFGEAAELIKPLVAARKGKASPALAALHVRLARLAGYAGDRKGELAALTLALDADKKNGEIASEVADRAEEADDLDLALKALRLIVAHNAPGSISVPAAFLRQAKIIHRRGETERAVTFARRAAHDAPDGDPVQLEAKKFLKAHEQPPPPRKSR